MNDSLNEIQKKDNEIKINKNIIEIKKEKEKEDVDIDNNLLLSNIENKERINSIYNNIQIRKSQNLNYNIYNNFEKPDTDNNNSRGKIKLKKSKSLENLSKENNIDINKK